MKIISGALPVANGPTRRMRSVLSTSNARMMNHGGVPTHAQSIELYDLAVFITVTLGGSCIKVQWDFCDILGHPWVLLSLKMCALVPVILIA